MSKTHYASESNKLQVKKFLEKVEKKLPEWLKEKKKEKNDILQEMEEHIWDVVDDLRNDPVLQENGVQYEEIVQRAIAKMGTPDKIASEYKKRGTPKIYITEELFPFYKQTVAALFGIAVIVNILANALTQGISAGQFLLNLIEGALISGLAVMVVATLIWTGLSMQGYLPEDLGIKEEVVVKNGKQTTKRKYQPTSPEKAEEKEPIRPLEYAVGGFFVLTFGLLFIFQPYESLNNLFNPEFMKLMRYSGYITVAEAAIYFGRVFVGKRNIFGHQALVSGFIATNICEIVLTHWLIENPFWLEWNMFTMPLWVIKVILVFQYLGLFDKIKDVAKVGKEIREYYYS